MQLWRPVISNRVTQGFGENKACTYPNGKIVGKQRGVCPSGSREFYPSVGMKGHNGTDFSTWHGEPVYHCADWEGKMKIEKDFQGGIGVDVISLKPIKLKDGYTGYVKTRSWHLKSPVGHDGKIVRLGEQIGLADNTGASSGDHLHFGVKKCAKDGRSLHPGNGYNGAFNHEPYMNLEVDAKTAAEDLFKEAPILSPQEKKEVRSQLSKAKMLLLLLQELKRRLRG